MLLKEILLLASALLLLVGGVAYRYTLKRKKRWEELTCAHEELLRSMSSEELSAELEWFEKNRAKNQLARITNVVCIFLSGLLGGLVFYLYVLGF